MLQAFKNILNIPELRRRVLFSLAMLAVYRVGGHIPTPGSCPTARIPTSPHSSRQTMAES